MESSEATNQLLKKKYDLHKSPEVENAAKRTRMRTGEEVPQNPLNQIQNYLDRLNRIVNPPQLEGHPNFDRKERNLEMLKSRLYDKFVIKPDEISENYWENQKRIIRERGQAAALEQVDWQELKRQNTEAIIADQKSSLDKWINYLSSSDAPYSDALKYFTLRSILYMGEYDKEKKTYPQRSKGTTKPFPDLNREALSYVLDAVEKKYQGKKTDQNDPEFEKLLAGENFAKLYAWAIEKVTPASEEELSANKGEWVKYKKGSDHMPLVKSLQGHGTGWCTAGESTAEAQLKGGDFYVYYSSDKDGKPTVPRAAIRMQDNKIGEVRGIAKEQNLDPYIGGVVEEKLKQFSDGELYKKKVSDMKLLTEMENKTRLNQDLTAQELVFLYEINASIDGFGYEKDPRIKELRSQRNSQEDMPIVFVCDKSQIARSINEINKSTKAYVGPLEPGILNIFQEYNIEHVYARFPEERISFESQTIGGKSKKVLKQEMEDKKINSSTYGEDMMDSEDFTTLKNPENITLVRCNIKALGIKNDYPTTNEVFARIVELGGVLCPAEVGPHKRLSYVNQPMNERVYIAMKPIADRGGNPSVFGLFRHVGGLWRGLG